MELPRLLASLNLPDDVPALLPHQRLELAREVRKVIIDVVSRNGGHLAPSLGVVELTIALLTAFRPGRDAIVWDVGHQSYPWKLLTGRAARFDTLRRLDGLSGFPRREESPYDNFGVGHASTSLSAALGMAEARDLRGGNEHVVAVIGDGALTGGMALEALNQAGAMGKRLIVVLNDNDMSISKSVGALSEVLSTSTPERRAFIRSDGPPASLSLFLSGRLHGGTARRFKNRMTKMLLNIPWYGHRLVSLAQQGENSFKAFFTPGMVFEAFRFHYIGPIDGHDTEQMLQYLETAKEMTAPVLLHVRTVKGKGYAPAEADPSRFHGVSCFLPETGRPAPAAPAPPSDEPAGPGFTCVFGQTLCELAETDPRIVAITAAMPDGTGTDTFRDRFPDRFVDVGICEEHAVTFAAGMATRGLRPVVAIYSTFLQRAYDQIMHDVCLQKLPVIFCLDRAGLVGEDGATHHGAFDLSWLRAAPNLSIIAPRDEADLRNALYTALSMDGPVAIRYPRGRTERLAALACDEEKPTARAAAHAGTDTGTDAASEPEAGQEAEENDAVPGNALLAGRPFSLLTPGEGEMLVHGQERVCLVTAGHRTHSSVLAARLVARRTGRLASVFDARWVKPLPEAQLLELARSHDALLIVEENSRMGGFSSAVLELLADHDALTGLTVRRLGLPDRFIPHGSARELRAMLGLDREGIANALTELLDLLGNRQGHP